MAPHKQRDFLKSTRRHRGMGSSSVQTEETGRDGSVGVNTQVCHSSFLNPD